MGVLTGNHACSDWLQDTDLFGNDIKEEGPMTMEECCERCWNISNCAGVTFNKSPPGYADHMCNLKFSSAGKRHSPGEYSMIIRPNFPPPPPPPPPSPPPSPTPPANVPSSWKARNATADMLIGVPTTSRAGYQGVHVGNGYISSTLDTHGTEFIAGVFNGKGTKSQRASIPSPLAGASPASNLVEHAAALDMHDAAFLRLFNVSSAALGRRTHNRNQRRQRQSTSTADSSLDDTCILRQYAHRSLHHVFVADVSCSLTAPATVGFDLVPAPSIAVTSQVVHSTSDVLCQSHTIREPEETWSPAIQVVSCTRNLGSGNTAWTNDFPAGESSSHVVSTRYSSIDDDVTDNSTQALLTRALQDYGTAMNMSTAHLFEEHMRAVAAISAHQPRVHGNIELARVVNASMYALMTTVRENVTYSSSPGGLATNSYHGHTFWDVETWMWPNWNIFHPLVRYRAHKSGGARDNGVKHHFYGLMFPWESAFTGQEVDPAPGTTIEEHIQGDIVFAYYQHWLLTADVDWLRSTAFPVIEGIAQFWASKAVPNKDGSFSIPDIMGPDEYHGPVNDSLSLRLAYSLAHPAGRPQNETFKHVGDNLVILFDDSQQYHPEFKGYNGSVVKQADVILLGYPLGYNMTAKVRKNDLNFYAIVTDPRGPAMTWSMFAIGFMDIDMLGVADPFFLRSYAENINGNYLVWSEVAGGGGAQNFITGAGGFMQCVWAGYGGLRITDNGLLINNPRPPPNSTSIDIDGFSYLGHVLSLSVHSASAWTLLDTTPKRAEVAPLRIRFANQSSMPLQIGTPVHASGTAYIQEAQP
ncbi:hypothetical protein PTSG_06584 [Salpingoeca rosetta]|uniref:Protein-glucosylgalactosylhydroxylysine glucosidase n=1 Tax=Salpingoeca rosetta (strain ATCC 50818 / BSB-021) TaxID=946362 RepID=F2UG85_SALR5|nr:uncharacterized protein PTSG_06584 [Salpingoeca rosetta]EGD75513.1 hypothetical protein PTSG_06584 [Salpingoeca rosetta]|eukprot:XP_004991970.1 hypothetical protein PTSG_06584 [Salpingoeca rosetta]